MSPDGSLRSDDNSVQFAFEEKAPFDKTFSTTRHYKVPDRYIEQTLFEQKVLNANGTLYMSWTDQNCTLFKVSTKCIRYSVLNANSLVAVYFINFLKLPIL